MKKIFVLIFAAVLFVSSGVVVSAVDEDTENAVFSDLFNSLSDETKQALEDSGLNKTGYDEIIELSPRDFISFFTDSLMGRINGPIKTFLILMSIIIILSAAQSYFPDNEKRNDYLNTVASVIIGLISFKSFFPLIKGAMSVIDVSSKFMTALLPILAGLIASCRNPVLAVSMNSVSIYLANIIALFSDKYLSPFMSIYLAICSAGCFSKEIKLSYISNFIKNSVIKILSVLSSFYISFLSIKGLFTNAVDTVASKGVKLLIGTAVPIIGSSLSDAYFAFSGSLSLLKNSVGVFGIIVIMVVNVPMIIELFLWSFFLSICVGISGTLNSEYISGFLDSLSCVVKTLNVIIIFCATLFIISTGIMITFRGDV